MKIDVKSLDDGYRSEDSRRGRRAGPGVTLPDLSSLCGFVSARLWSVVVRPVLLLACLMLPLMGTAFAAEHPAQSLVVSAVDNFLEFIRDNREKIKSDSALLDNKIEELVVPHLDFEAMTKLSIGKYWRNADATQRRQLIQEFRTFLLNTYTSAIDEYKDGDVSFEKFKPGKRDDRAVVRSQFAQAGSADVAVVYKLRNKDGWKIYDIEVSQLSLVTNYRSSFASEINRNGIDGLIKLLQERNG